MSDGCVYLVGAGPGDPGLITVRGLACVREADVVVYDFLANPALVREARADAERVCAGKRGGDHTMSQAEINALLVAKGREGRTVCRLKGGDPFVFGRGGEEAAALAEAGVAFEVVPGVTAGVAAPAYAGIPVTHRGRASAVAFVTGHEDPTKAASALDWGKLAGVGTLVVYMGVKRLPQIVEQLTAHGLAPATPAAMVRWGTMPHQRTVTGTLADIVERSRDVAPPAVLVVGEVVSLREQLAWLERRPLFGRCIVVTRSRAQASTLSARLAALGAEVVEMPTIRIEPPEDYAPLDEAVARLADYDAAVFTSVNGVDAFFARLARAGKDSRAVPPVVAAIGPATAERLAEHGVRADCQPERFTGEALVAALVERGGLAGRRVLLARAAEAPPTVTDGLEAAGARGHEGAAYRTRVGAEPDQAARARLMAGEVDAVTLTSSSTVRGFVAAVGAEQAAALPPSVRLASIGPVTSATARELGLSVAVEACEHTIPGLVEAILTLPW